MQRSGKHRTVLHSQLSLYFYIATLVGTWALFVKISIASQDNHWGSLLELHFKELYPDFSPVLQVITCKKVP